MTRGEKPVDGLRLLPVEMTRVVNIRNLDPDWREDPEFVYIGRGSKWGNPFMIGVLTRNEAIASYAEHLETSGLIDDIEALRGKFLVCYCSPLPCHGDVLVRRLND